MLHAGVLKNLDSTVCCVWRFRWFQQARNTGPVCWLFCYSVNIIYIGLVTIAQKRLDWMLPTVVVWVSVVVSSARAVPKL